jgi:CubicO group peptidase (beta-lactamase class C family)
LIAFLLVLGVEAGWTSPDDSITRLLPELPGWITGVRLHHLLHHTFGLPDLAASTHGSPLSNGDVMNRFQRFDARPTIHPGRQFRYNNAGHVLLAEAVSRLFDYPITQLAWEQIVEPLGMYLTLMTPLSGGGGPVSYVVGARLVAISSARAASLTSLTTSSSARGRSWTSSVDCPVNGISS